MQEGIGRSGYRVIALVFFAVGLLGLATSLYSFRPDGLYGWLGFSLAAIALVALLVLCLAVLRARLPSLQGMPAPSGAPAVTLEPVPDLLPVAQPEADLGVEYADEDIVPAVASEAPAYPVPPSPPRAPPYVPPRRTPPEPKGGWPKRKAPSGVTRGEARKRERDMPEFEAGREPPLVMARTAASVEASGIPDNVSLGKCGNCQVLLLAPRRRPIRLQCPRCERVHTMT